MVELEQALAAFAPSGDILELACGTGWWTERLSRYGASLTAVDASPEVLELNRKRLPSARIDYVEADLFSWRPERTFDTVFFQLLAFTRAAGAVRGVLGHRAELPQPRWVGVFFIDSRYTPEATAKDHTPEQFRGPFRKEASRRRSNLRDRQGLLRTGAARGATRCVGLAR